MISDKPLSLLYKIGQRVEIELAEGWFSGTIGNIYSTDTVTTLIIDLDDGRNACCTSSKRIKIINEK